MSSSPLVFAALKSPYTDGYPRAYSVSWPHSYGRARIRYRREPYRHRHHHVAVEPSSSAPAPSDLASVDARYQRRTVDYFHESIRDGPPPFSNNNNGDGTFNNVWGDQFNNPHYHHYYGTVFVNRSERMLPSTDDQTNDPEPLSQSYEPTLSNVNTVCQLLDQFPSSTMPCALPALLENMKGFALKIAVVARSLDIINDIPTGIRELSAFRQAHDLIRCLNAHLSVILQDIRCISQSIRRHPSLIEIFIYNVITKYRWRAIYHRAVFLLNANHLVLADFAHAICSGCGKVIEGEPAQKLENLIASSPLLKSPLVYHLRMLTLTVRDHAGRRLPIPLEYCSTWSDMRIVLKHLCHDVDGIEYLERDDWEIIRTSNNETLDMDHPLSPVLSEEIVSSHEILDLSIIMRAVRASLSTCPGCSYNNSGTQVPCNNWITCGRCGKTFQVIATTLVPPPRQLLTERRQLPLPTKIPSPKRHVFSTLFQPLKQVNPFRRRGRGTVKVKEEHSVTALAPPAIEHTLPSAITNVQFPRISIHAESIWKHCHYEMCEGMVYSLHFHNNGKHVLSAGSAGWSVWDADTGVVKESGSFNGESWCPAFSPDGLHIAAGFRSGFVEIWDIGAKKTPVTLDGHDHRVSDITFSYDNKYLATCSHDSTVRIWSLTLGKETTSHVLASEDPYCVAFSPDGTLFASGSKYGRISIWDTRTWKLHRELKGHHDWVHSLSFSPDGTCILSGSRDNTVCVWSISGDPILALRGHTWHVYAVAWSLDGRYFASASGDGTVRLWDSTTGQTLQVFEAGANQMLSPWDLDDKPESVAFSADGSRLVAGTVRGIVHIWHTGLL